MKEQQQPNRLVVTFDKMSHVPGGARLVLPISLSIKNQSEKNAEFSATIDELIAIQISAGNNPPIKEITIVLADRLQWRTRMMWDQVGDKKQNLEESVKKTVAKAWALQKGNEWLIANDKSLKKLREQGRLEVRVLRWEDVCPDSADSANNVALQDYKEHKRLLATFKETNTERGVAFDNVVRNTATGFASYLQLEHKRTRDNKDPTQNISRTRSNSDASAVPSEPLIRLSQKYILQELAVILGWFLKQQYHFIAYPFGKGGTGKKILQCMKRVFAEGEAWTSQQKLNQTPTNFFLMRPVNIVVDEKTRSTNSPRKNVPASLIQREDTDADVYAKLLKEFINGIFEPQILESFAMLPPDKKNSALVRYMYEMTCVLKTVPDDPPEYQISNTP